MIYLDNAATTAVLPAAADKADEVLRACFANPSALYTPGARSEQALNDAREQVAQTLGCAEAEVYFTACGSESNNIAIQGAARARAQWGSHIVVTGFEHPSVQNTVAALAQQGWRVTVVNPDAQGHISTEEMVQAVTPQTALVCCMHINNEIGSVQEVALLAQRVKQKNSRTAVHIDGVQAWCKQPLRLRDTQIDTYSVSGHKVHAPKGIGALYVRKGFYIQPVVFGGGQEKGLRPGTENIAYAAAMAQAAAYTQQRHRALSGQLAAMQQHLLAALAQTEGVVLNSPADAAAGMVNFSVLRIKSETMLHYLESKDIYVSSGSACSRGAASHTLAAMGLDKSRIDTAVRVSFGIHNTQQELDALLAAVQSGQQSLAKIRA